MKKTPRLTAAYEHASATAWQSRHEFVTPEHLLLAIFQKVEEFQPLFASYQVNREHITDLLNDHIDMSVDTIPEEVGDYELLASAQLVQVITLSEAMAKGAGRKVIDVPHVLNAIMQLDESYAHYCLAHYFTDDQGEFLSCIDKAMNGEELPLHITSDDKEDYYTYEDVPSADTRDDQVTSWRKLVTCINDLLSNHNPLIGREAELDRTIQVLCRCEKNNPLHVGEPGVGKTALVYGLAARIERGEVPERLKGCRIYQMDMGSMVAGTTYRGDFEKRIKAVMEGALKEGNAIIYIDEIHTLVGSGASSDGSLDGSNMLKPYLEGGQLRFIGSTTYQEYNRYFQKSHGLVRRFQQIDIPEPSIEETIHILEGLQAKYEAYHGVKYAEGVLRYAVEAAAHHINERFLPDKAIDLIDESGAYRELHPIMRKARKSKATAATVPEATVPTATVPEATVPGASPSGLIPQKAQWVTRELINDVLARICKIDPKALKEEDNQHLEDLAQRLQAQIYGQDLAIQRVVEAVQMGKAGLLDDQKPVASLLFVGPTGVGKTEVCKVLAQELGIGLVRFDMSEYIEKHTVAKLIGSPAGYVGYEDGGLLTDAIRKTPNCVLLLDEIEKAHADIYNILLQVMDYARLTDNKGQKADFRHVILVMTSNAGAQYAHQAQIGFGSNVTAGQAMLGTVKKTFKPEFLARLSDTVVFNDMDRTMAGLILDKKLRQLQSRLDQRHVTLQLTPAAHDFLLERGFTRQLGAREMDRQINQLLSPLLMRQILFGSLKQGGIACVDVNASNELCINGK